jgi:alkyl sulfatase BDS1-like metallo-beta-lactamase superfamily hydrolase
VRHRAQHDICGDNRSLRDLLLTSHDHPVHGRDRIRHDLGKIADAVRYIYKCTLDGMAAAKSLKSPIADIQLPPEIKPNNGRAPLSWQVRAVWEEYAGWNRAVSVTGLYPVPQWTIWLEIKVPTVGAMRTQTEGMPDADKRAVAEYLTGKKIAKPACRTVNSHSCFSVAN